MACSNLIVMEGTRRAIETVKGMSLGSIEDLRA